MPGGKLTQDFLKRIQEQARQRIEQRIRRELEPQVQAPELRPNLRGPEEERQPGQGLVDRLKTKVKEQVSQLSPVQRRMLDPNAVLDLPTIKFRIMYAGQNHLLLNMRYNQQWRMVAPYSYRMVPQKGGGSALRFYGFCYVHNKIHSFKLEKVEGLVVTDRSFTPMWPIELA